MKSNKRLKILYLSNGDASSGGAGRVAQMLADGMAEKGHYVVHAMRRKPCKTIKRKATVKWYGRIPGERIIRDLFYFDSAGLRMLISGEYKKFDIIHFHDMALAWGEKLAFHAIKNGKKFLLHYMISLILPADA